MGDDSVPQGKFDFNFLFYKFCPFDLKLLKDEEWEYTEEPHCARRKEILTKHPEIKKLMGYDPNMAYVITAQVFIQLGLAWVIQDYSWPVVLIASYTVGGLLQHSLGIGLHELAHNLAFGHSRPVANRILSLWCNLPVILPIAISHKKYHLDHHRYLGDSDRDIDVPTSLESHLFRNPVTKAIWVFLHPLWWCLRPLFKCPKPVTGWEVINWCTQIIFAIILYYTFGGKSLTYLTVGTLLSLGLHPSAGHFISEHCLMNGGQSTISYYGPLNVFLFNAGYHVEHHDFPYIPYSRLPALKRLAPEYYDNLFYHTSLVKVIWDFIFNEKYGPHARGVGYRKVEVQDYKDAGLGRDLTKYGDYNYTVTNKPDKISEIHMNGDIHANGKIHSNGFGHNGVATRSATKLNGDLKIN